MVAGKLLVLSSPHVRQTDPETLNFLSRPWPGHIHSCRLVDRKDILLNFLYEDQQTGGQSVRLTFWVFTGMCDS